MVRYPTGACFPASWCPATQRTLKQYVANVTCRLNITPVLQVHLNVPRHFTLVSDFFLSLTTDLKQLLVYASGLVEIKILFIVAPEEVGEWMRWVRRSGLEAATKTVGNDKGLPIDG